MAPIGDDVAQKILDSIQDLQARIKKLEDGIQHKTGGPAPSAVEGVRMILMGPPGAGMWLFPSI
jgi:adenylate kinase